MVWEGLSVAAVVVPSHVSGSVNATRACLRACAPPLLSVTRSGEEVCTCVKSEVYSRHSDPAQAGDLEDA